MEGIGQQQQPNVHISFHSVIFVLLKNGMDGGSKGHVLGLPDVYRAHLHGDGVERLQ